MRDTCWCFRCTDYGLYISEVKSSKILRWEYELPAKIFKTEISSRATWERGTWILIFVPNPRSNAALRVQYANFENRPIGAGRSKKCKKFLGYLSISLLNYTILGYVKCFKHLSIKIKIPFKEISCRVPERISTRGSGISNKFLRPEAKHRRSYPAPAQNQKCSKNRPVEAGCWKEMSSDT